MSGKFNIFDLHQTVIGEYKSYVKSFIHINDPQIRQFVDSKITDGAFWPEPLLQFNPSLKRRGPIASLAGPGKLLRPELAQLFEGYEIYEHQAQAMELGIQGRDFVVTSGTGSGKSLTYLGSIFHRALSEAWGSGIRAILVYPMNALINSQFEEIKKYQKNFEDIAKKPFPVQFAMYTGQENESDRQKVEDGLPQVILTNYMMLELIMTRRKESRLRESIRDNLQFLLFDELHMYRGRQGADIAMLVRRIRAAAKNKVVCFGTSATMASGKPSEQRKAVASFSSTIFGTQIIADQIVSETIEPAFSARGKATADELRQALLRGCDTNDSEEALLASPLAHWLESEIALARVEEETGTVIIRGKPLAQTNIEQRLAEATGVDLAKCKATFQNLLLWINRVNSKKSDFRKSYLPYKVHQFISQTGSVYATLPNVPGGMKLRIEPGVSIKIDGVDYPIYPLVFSRATGCAYYCVAHDEERGMLPRDFEDYSPEAGDDAKNGYFILGGSDIWDPDEQMENMPDEWVTISNGERKFNKETQAKAPQHFHLNPTGAAFKAPGKNTTEGWFMPEPLLFDPTGGVFFDHRTSEGTKLARLGMEGRSTATTVTSLAVLRAQEGAELPVDKRKILSFSDNRQDSALQAGHFNDLVKVVELRHGIAKALGTKAELDHTTIDNALYNALGLEPRDYAKIENPEGPVRAQLEKTFREYLFYRVLADLRRGWRINLPNLEQTGLLTIGYRNLEEVSRNNETWKEIPVLGTLDIARREVVLGNILDHIRREYAISSENWLNSDEKIIQCFRNINEKLKAPWLFDDHTEKPENFSPRVISLTGTKGGKRYRISSAGPRSVLGKYLRKVGQEVSVEISKEKYPKAIEALFEKLVNLGFLDTVASKGEGGAPVTHYRIKLDCILWRPGDGKEVKWDEVRRYTYQKLLRSKPNQYFQNLYRTGFGRVTRYLAEDHTAQVNSDHRKQREKDFREGKLSALFCSPTMELGIDIRTLDVVHMRSVPPGPANYAQRGGRAGRSGQSALILVTCSPWSPHDNHYFGKPSEMIAGQVSVPRIDLCNEELIRSHLHALFMEANCPGALKDSIGNLLEIEKPELPLAEHAQNDLVLLPANRAKLAEAFKHVLGELHVRLLDETQWYDEEWIERKFESASNAFDKCLGRWRGMYLDTIRMQEKSQAVKRNPHLKTSSDEYRDAERQEKQAIYLRGLLLNQNKGTLSEFYPWRYLASEGFLPGYNFTRLPLRAAIPVGDSCEYLSRPRFVALREFGPQNLIYHSGNKYQVNQLSWNEDTRVPSEARVVVKSGYWLSDQEKNAEVCPFTGEKLEAANRDYKTLSSLVPMMESHTQPISRITCEEEERVSKGYRIDTFFSVDGGKERVRNVPIEVDGEKLLNLSYIPAARIVQVNRGWRDSNHDGFYIGEKSGFYKSAEQYKDFLKKKKEDGDGDRSKEEITSINLYTSANADALYIQPLAPLGLGEDGVITLQYALLGAIVREFQIEPNEIAATRMGDPKQPNIFIFEASEGSLGILTQFAHDPSLFTRIIKAAQKVCRYDEPEYEDKASYQDLLSYYNQREHHLIDRFLIKDALEKLALCIPRVDKAHGIDYESQYETLKAKADPHSVTETKFLKFLHDLGLRLPDEAQKKVPDLYCQPDFYYKGTPEVWVFCDGSPHDGVAERKNDKNMRDQLRDRGYDVIEWHYRDPLEKLVERRRDIFRKVK